MTLALAFPPAALTTPPAWFPSQSPVLAQREGLSGQALGADMLIIQSCQGPAACGESDP